MRVLASPRSTWARAVTLAGGVVSLAAGCARGPEIEERTVVVYSPRACPVSQTDAYSVIYAGGDFEPSIERPPIASTFLREIGRTMTELPPATRSLVVDVSQRDIGWRGLADIPSRGPVNVLVWPNGESCRLTRDVERRTDMALGVFGRHFMVVGGRSSDGSSVPHTYVGDLATGAIERLAFGLRTRRANPTVTPFRAPSDDEGPMAALVAGGHDPDSDFPDVPLRALSTAEVYVPRIGAPNDVGDFDEQRIDLSEARTRHGAVVLATGETLLVGGRGAAGPLRTMEIVDPATRRSRTSGVALLAVARESPTVLRLSSGEILVAGGVDAHDKEIPTLEWFAPDGSRATKRPVDLVTGKERAFVALEAGGALAVIRPADAAIDFKTVWVISADGTLEPGHPIDPATLDTVRLFPGAEGAPVLWTGRRWMRWSPWFGSFEAIAIAPSSEQPSPGPALEAIASGDSGLALWLDDRGEGGMNVTGFRFATRTRFDAVPKPLLTTGTAQLAPDRLVGLSESAIRFDVERGLVLGPGASAFLTDVTFADFELQLDVTAAAPMIVLRPARGPELELGGAACAFVQAARETIDVKRRGTRVTVDVDGAGERACPVEIAPNERVSLGLRGAHGARTSSGRHLRVTRL